MTKTIEELASEYYLNEVINGDTCDDKDGWTDCFVSGAEALMQLPLASRLTPKEKERVRKAYQAMSDYGKNKGVECASCANYAARIWMERIFGADFFKEGE
jgi:hypothetical protein|nr:MAG TPA: pepsin inhibitor [Caudoviricetes sp.]